MIIMSIYFFIIFRLNKEISKTIFSMNSNDAEDNELMINGEEDDITSINEAFPNLFLIDCYCHSKGLNRKSLSSFSSFRLNEFPVFTFNNAISTLSHYNIKNNKVSSYFSNKNYKNRIYLYDIISGL